MKRQKVIPELGRVPTGNREDGSGGRWQFRDQQRVQCCGVQGVWAFGVQKDMPGTHGALKNCMLSSETWVLRWRDLRATKGFKQEWVIKCEFYRQRHRCRLLIGFLNNMHKLPSEHKISCSFRRICSRRSLFSSQYFRLLSRDSASVLWS